MFTLNRFLALALLVFAPLISAGQSFGPAAIWKPDANFRQAVVSACSNRGAQFDECFAEQMKAAGATPEAMAFTHAVHDNGYMEGFRRVGPVAVAAVMYPFRANENSALVIVNGDPAVVDVDALNKLPADQMKADPAYQAMVKDHADASLWPGDRSSTNSLLPVILADGSEEIITGYRVQAGCHACAVLGQAFFGFEFDPHGKMTGIKFTGFTPHFSGDRSGADKMLRVTPNSQFTILLPANPTTGYSWTLAENEAKAKLKVSGHRYEAGGKLIGGGGEEHWSFHAPGSGTYKLTFNYKRPWEKNTAPAKSLEISVQVQ